jgi:hypothetical protein
MTQFMWMISAVTVVAGACMMAVGHPRAALPLQGSSAELFAAAMREYDARWDADERLIGSLKGEDGAPHGVRESAYYATALLFRDGPGDRERAVEAIRGVLGQQISEPGAIYHGTFYRRPQEPRIAPGSSPTVWKDYDPNWRQFVGCCWSIILLKYPDRIPPDVRSALLRSLELAVDGEVAARRLGPGYTNIAIMHAFILGVCADVAHRDDLRAERDRFVSEVTRLFRRTDTFDEYNSPTYYGVDFFALSLWRELGTTPQMREYGEAIERDLWLDTADYYHAGLRNQCGPFDRTYGMDMTKYVALQGLLIRMHLPGKGSPFPELDGPMGHRHDFAAAMIYPIVPTAIPPTALEKFVRFEGDRRVERTLGDGRVSTAWLSKQVMIGGQTAPRPRDVTGPGHQYRPATMHWLEPGGEVAWAALIRGEAVGATASARVLHVTATGGMTFRILCPQIDPKKLTKGSWTLPGLRVAIETDASDVAVSVVEGGCDVHYVGATTLQLSISEEASAANP